jgi:uncharacterized membrane protein
MFCRNCGKELTGTPEICVGCGAKPLAGNKFCQACGAQTDPIAEICIKCGVRLQKPAKASTGLEPNVAGLLCYLVGWITGLVFILIEKENQFVRFHAMQSIIIFGGFTVIHAVLGILQATPYIWVLFMVIQAIFGLLAFVLWILLMVKAYQGEKFKLPWVGDLAEKYI